VIPLLDSADLVMEVIDHPGAGTAAYRFVTPTGVTLATMQETRSPMRSLGRLLSRNPGTGPALLHLVDGEGNAVLAVEKNRLRPLGKLRVAVALADGTAVGSADGRLAPGRLRIALRNPAGEVEAELRGGSGGQYELIDPRGTEVGVLARQLLSRTTLPSGVWRSYRISFSPSAGVAVRSLALAVLAALDLRLL
jgi:hypothetical protein